MNMLEKIQSQLEHLSKSERKVAEVILASPDNAIHSSIAAVLQRMSCMNCSDGDVVVLISHTGRTKNLVELAQLARENDAMVIALTSAGTPLAREATLAITLDVPEDTDIYMPMVSRLAQLTVIDVLATGFTLRRGAKFRDNLKRVKEALKESRFDKQLLNLSDDR